jgi:hypothetical protein
MWWQTLVVPALWEAVDRWIMVQICLGKIARLYLKKKILKNYVSQVTEFKPQYSQKEPNDIIYMM